MSNITHGMNIDEVRAGAQQLLGASAQLADVLHTLSMVAETSTWVGPDAATFQTVLAEQVRPDLQEIMAMVEGFAQSMNNNASEQEATSAH